MRLAPRRRRAGRSSSGRRRRTCVSRAPRTRSSPRSRQAALGGNDSFRRQLNTALDAWMATLDSVLTRDSNGHHGVSVGDADGDGLDDLYVAQPAGLPNRLLRARGDGDVRGHHRAARASASSTTRRSRSSPTSTTTATRTSCWRRRRSRCSSSTTARGASRPSPDAFRFARPLQGVLTSIAMADYDRDGFLDLYLCVYSYFFGAGEDKAGTPAPYHDARNGPPGVLFRNDGHGRFVDATARGGPRRRQRPLSLRRGVGRLRRRRLARPAGRERLRHQEPLPQPRARATAR